MTPEQQKAYNEGVNYFHRPDKGFYNNPYAGTAYEHIWTNGLLDARNADIEKFRAKWPIPTISPASFINMTLEEAEKNSGGWLISPSIIDGKHIPQSASLCPIRVCVEIKNNIIVGTTGVGW